jgi:DNA-binding GntR family transcriptional regulator
MVTYRSLKDIVYEYISNQITSGKMKPNASISEAAICSDLGTSRTPVREALMQLSNEGYIEHIPRRGFFTRSLTVERVQNIFEIIGNLEGLAAALAVEHPEALDLNILCGLLDEMDQAIAERQYNAYNQLQNQFHQALIQACGNADLIRLIGSLKKLLMQQQYVQQKYDEQIHPVFLGMNEEHRQMVRLLQTGDKEAVRAYVRDVHWNVKYAALHVYA